MSERGRRRAAAWFLRFLVVAGVAVVVLLPPLSTTGERAADTARIVSYTARMDLSRDGTLRSVETIQVDVPGGKHGIFRTFDTADPRRRGVDHPVSEVSVTRDGQPEPAEWTSSAAGTANLRIGDPNVYLTPGEHTYVIDSTTVDALEVDPRDDGRVVWWWDVVGSGWQMAMDRARVEVRLPATPVGPAECVLGVDTPCTADVADRSLTVTTGPLEPFTPVTVRVPFDARAVSAPPTGSPLGPTVWWSLVAAVAAVGVGVLLARSTREEPPGFPVLYEPPAGLYPALAAKVLDEAHASDDVQATLFDLGERGVVRLDGDGSTWTVQLLVHANGAGLRPGELDLLEKLGVVAAGDSFTVTRSDVEAGRRISRARSALRSAVDRDAAALLEASGPGLLARALGAGAILATLAMVGVYELSDTGWVSWPLLTAAAALALVLAGAAVDRGAGSRRTTAGRDAWSRAGGFARLLGTESAESRFDAAAHRDYFARYLPWAVAFGSAEAWSRRFRDQGVPVDDPGTVPYLYWYGAGRYSSSSFTDSFNASIAAASAAYVASQSASSGGGGGFSGGSGGGGGGGGSW